jgi:hypothetical protein
LDSLHVTNFLTKNNRPATYTVRPCMQNRTPFLVHLAAYAALLTIAACGALESSTGDSNTVQSQAPTQAGATTVPSADANTYAGASNANATTGNANVVSPNTMGDGNAINSNAINSNATDSNTTIPKPDCSKTWTNYAQAFFTNNCADCHSHSHASLTTYSHVVSAGPAIQTYISSKVMPVGAKLSAGDYNNILNWFACNMPQ